MLADSWVRRWGDHLPAHRLEKIYAREGLSLSRATICSWHIQLASLVQPLMMAMWEDAFSSPYLCTDATGVLVQAKERCTTGHFWVVVAPELHVLFGFSHKHDGAAVDALLQGYQGFLVADAHAVYDHLYASGDITEVGCWAHLRRYFFKTIATDPECAHQALRWIGALFEIERKIKFRSPKKKKAIRQEYSKPIVDAFFQWRDEQAKTALDETPLSKGLTYAQNQRSALMRFLDDGRLPMHNNISELMLRWQAIGRKNWLCVSRRRIHDVTMKFAA